MISNILMVILFIVFFISVTILQIINLILTIIQYCFVYKKYENLQELFIKNSSYLDEFIKD